jgi:uncharacterized protein
MNRPGTLSSGDRQALEDYTSRLRFALGERIVELRLFGSKARGEGNAESDIDVLVVVEALDPKTETQIVDLAFDVNLDHGVVISPVVFSRETRDHPLWPLTDLGRAAEREGIPL